MLGNVLSRLSLARPLRQIVLPLFERFNPGDVGIRHHYTGRRLRLHSFRHRGYWYHGRRRERETMQFFERVLRPGDLVVEVGGHIGYITMWFAQLVGAAGRVVVFEPGRNNLPYLRQNVARLANVEIVESAVSNQDGTATFYEEELTGQNNSLLGDYERFTHNRESAHSSQQYYPCEVTTVRLDSFVNARSIVPTLIKIDIEGAELLALEGAKGNLVQHRPMLMVEVTRQADEVFKLLSGTGYMLFTPEGAPLRGPEAVTDNVCAVHWPTHQERLPAHWGTNVDRMVA